MRLKLVEGTPPEAEYYRMMPDWCMFGERKGGEIVFRDDNCNEWTLTDGQLSVHDVRPLPPGTIITITVRDAAPHDVRVDKPGPAVYWMEWCEVKPGQVVVSKDGDWYRKNPLGFGCGADVNHEYSRENMRRSLYRRPFDPWHLEPVEEPTP